MLEYEARKSKGKYTESEEDVRWRFCRYGYWLAQVGVFVLLAFWVFPNFRLFGRLTGPKPADFVPVVQTRFAPLVAAIKAYQRDNGRLPYGLEELSPKYIARTNEFASIGGGFGANLVTFQVNDLHCVIGYELTPGLEAWTVYSPRYDGPVPAPLVPPAPATQPTSGPVSPTGGL